MAILSKSLSMNITLVIGRRFEGSFWSAFGFLGIGVTQTFFNPIGMVQCAKDAFISLVRTGAKISACFIISLDGNDSHLLGQGFMVLMVFIVVAMSISEKWNSVGFLVGAGPMFVIVGDVRGSLLVAMEGRLSNILDLAVFILFEKNDWTVVQSSVVGVKVGGSVRGFSISLRMVKSSLELLSASSIRRW